MLRQAAIIVFGLPGLALAQRPSRAEILIVGTYHMANRNHDQFNVLADDVLAPRRQQEMTRLIDLLRRFHPTKIAIEADLEGEQVKQQYSDYLAGKYTLSRDETNQLGYRLGKELGHKQVYAVNAWSDVEFPLARVVHYAKATGTASELDTTMQKWGTAVKELDDYLAHHSILETLEFINSDTFISENVSPYFEVARFGDPSDWAGPDLVATWYQRNIRIYHNIKKLIETPNDRILVFYGYGHLGWLQQCAEHDANVRLVRLRELVSP